MRSHWEDRDELDLDAPATVTERDLRSLRRRAGFGVFAVLLSIISIGGLAWTLYAGPEGLEQVQGVKDRLLGQESAAQPASVAPATQAQSPGATESPTTQPVAGDGATATPLGPQPAANSDNAPESRRVSTQGSAAGN